MNLIFLSLFPIFILIVLGYYFRRISFPGSDFWAKSDKLTYFVLLPSMLVHSLATTKFTEQTNIFLMIGLIVLLLLVASIVLFMFQKIFKIDPKEFTSVYQGAIRFNNYVFLGIIGVLYGSDGIASGIFIMTFLVPVINFLCVGTFIFYLTEGGFSFKKLFISIAKNPIIIACALGATLNFTQIGLPFVFEPIFKILGAPAITMGLLSVGVGLRFGCFKELKFNFWLACAIKLIILPLCMVAITSLFGITGTTRLVMVIFTAIPTATTSYILSREMGGDLELMSTIITAQTLFSFISLGGIILWLL